MKTNSRVKRSSNLKPRYPRSKTNAHVAGANYKGSDRT